MSKFLHEDDNDVAKAKAIPRVFSERSGAKNEQITKRKSLNEINKVFMDIPIYLAKTPSSFYFSHWTEPIYRPGTSRPPEVGPVRKYIISKEMSLTLCKRFILWF